MKIPELKYWIVSIIFAAFFAAVFWLKSPSPHRILICKLNISNIFDRNPYEPLFVSLFDTSDAKKEIIKKEINDRTWTVTFTDLSNPIVNVSFHNFIRIQGRNIHDIDTIISNVHLSDSITVVSLDYPFLSNSPCPICHRYDQVIPIKYGIGVPSKIGTKKIDVDYIDGGCSVTNLWYCKRDSASF